MKEKRKKAKNREEVRSFLGMADHHDNVSERYATIAAPLYQLTRKKSKRPSFAGAKKKKMRS
jgi:hypothetical protein